MEPIGAPASNPSGPAPPGERHIAQAQRSATQAVGKRLLGTNPRP